MSCGNSCSVCRSGSGTPNLYIKGEDLNRDAWSNWQNLTDGIPDVLLSEGTTLLVQNGQAVSVSDVSTLQKPGSQVIKTAASPVKAQAVAAPVAVAAVAAAPVAAASATGAAGTSKAIAQMEAEEEDEWYDEDEEGEEEEDFEDQTWIWRAALTPTPQPN
eukprot:s2639_g6.t1